MTDVKYINVNGKDYIITDEVDFQSFHYMLAVEESNADAIMIIKQSFEDGKEMAISVVDDDEFELVIKLFKDKH